MPTLESLLTIPQASKLTGVSTRTFQRLIDEARAPDVVRIGRAVRIRASDMDLWLKLGCPDRETLRTHTGGQGVARD